jgi:EF-P beta-lysylation protein EpmB
MKRKDEAPWSAGAWRKSLADVITDVDELLQILELQGDTPTETPAALRRFPLRVPRAFVARMRRGDPADPLLRQVLPTLEEDRTVPGFTSDPVGELVSPPRDAVLQKYRGRALLMVSGVCAVHCRYCFRRHFPYADHRTDARDFDAAIRRIAADPEIAEVILSGGDPLTLPDTELAVLAMRLAALPNVRRLRIHTRMPVVLPQRVDTSLATWIGGLDIPVTFVVHVNHANEIDDSLRRALAAVAATGATLLNQAVLLRGVNDTADALSNLSESLFDVGVLPYYLHMLDAVEGAAHFSVSDEKAKQVHREMAAGLPGYLVPRIVREVPDAPAKIGVELWR